tara:strand:- start:24 stop:860 length:837 start_codon:yes stop_codon:yes gene_type:complete
MAEETMTTESTDSPQTEQNAGSVLGSGSVGDNQDWRNNLPDDLRNDPTLQNYKDVESLAKTVVHQQKMIGSRIPLPKTDEEKAELYGKLGRPDSPDKYQVNLGQDYEPYFGEAALNEFKNVAHTIGLNNDQVNALIEFQKAQVDYELQNQPAQLETQRKDTEQSLKQEWGFDYDKNVRAAQRALDVYGDDDLKELMNTEVGNNPAMIKLFHRLGQEVTEDMAQNTQNNKLAISPVDARQEIDAIMQNPKHPYFDSRHREHRDAVEKVRQLHEKAFGTE